MATGRPWWRPQGNSPVPSARLRRCPGVYGPPENTAAADETRLLSERAGELGKLPLLLFLALYGVGE
jgi:hypothetical protein